VTSPVTICLDEPTSGLDSEIAVKMMRTLRTIASAGRTVALTVHQPNSDITELFDDFILMSKGKIMYASARQPRVSPPCCKWPARHAQGPPAAEQVGCCCRTPERCIPNVRDTPCALQARGRSRCPPSQWLGTSARNTKNPSDYFMHVACDAAGVKAMVATQEHRWASTKRDAFAQAMPSRRGSQEVAVALPGADGVGGDCTGADGAGHKRVIVDSPTVCSAYMVSLDQPSSRDDCSLPPVHTCRNARTVGVAAKH
jgi:energy-coupling factor transporter ATP-binding protein EcfA2